MLCACFVCSEFKDMDAMYLCRILIYFLFNFILGTSCRHRCYGAEVIYHFFYFFLFKFGDGIHNLIPNMWQVVFVQYFIQGRVLNSYIYSFPYGSSHIVPLPAYDLEVVYCNVASSVCVKILVKELSNVLCVSLRRF